MVEEEHQLIIQAHLMLLKMVGRVVLVEAVLGVLLVVREDLETLHQHHHHKEILAVQELLFQAAAAVERVLLVLMDLHILEEMVEVERYLLFLEHQ